MNPLDALSPVIVTQLRNPENPTPADRARFRGKVTRQVKECTNCEMHKEAPPTPFRGSPAARLIVVLGEPMTRKGGRLFNALLAETGWEPDDIFYVNTAACATDEETHHASRDETLACRGNLVDQLEAAYLPFVLLAGGKALDVFRSDLTITDHHGGLFVWLDRFVVVPTYHPVAALRGSSGYKRLIREDLERMHDIVFGGDNPLSFIGETCFKCKQDATWWDRDAVPMCDVHYKKWGKRWEKERYRWTGDPIIQLTL